MLAVSKAKADGWLNWFISVSSECYIIKGTKKREDTLSYCDDNWDKYELYTTIRLYPSEGTEPEDADNQDKDDTQERAEISNMVTTSIANKEKLGINFALLSATLAVSAYTPVENGADDQAVSYFWSWFVNTSNKKRIRLEDQAVNAYPLLTKEFDATCRNSQDFVFDYIQAANDVDAFLFSNEKEKITFIDFRGSDSLTDWRDFVSNRTLIDFAINGTKALVVSNWVLRFEIIKKWLEGEIKKVPQDHRLGFVGHSSGGALSMLAALYSAEKLGRRPDAVFAYGPPKLGSTEFASWYKKKMGCERTVIYINDGDRFVPKLQLSGATEHPCDAQYLHGNDHSMKSYLKAVILKFGDRRNTLRWAAPSPLATTA